MALPGAMRAPLGIYGLVIPPVIAIALWMITGSPFTLLFAASAPLLSLAARLDQRRRDGKERLARREADNAAAQQSANDAERVIAQQWVHSPSIFQILADGAPRARASGHPVVLGERHRAPVTLELDAPLAIIGPAVLVNGLIHAGALQQQHRGASDLPWHPVTDANALMPGVDHVVSLVSPTVAEVLRTRDGQLGSEVFVPHLLAQSALRQSVSAAGEYSPREQAAGRTLCAPIARDVSGSIDIDLCRGPHAAVVGASGTGKSELLRRWLTNLAGRYSPAEFTFAAIDFKGGSTFVGLSSLPHCLGVVSDIRGDATRALAALSVEVTRRESIFADLGVRGIDEVPGLALLVVVIDESAALMNTHTEARQVVSDLASRGRSLGIHMIVCSQRAIGGIPEAVLANAGLRLALRIFDASEAQTFIGSRRASNLDVPGGVLVSDGGKVRVGMLSPVAPAELTPMMAPSVSAPRWAGDSGRPALWPEPWPSLARLAEVAHRTDLDGPMRGALGVINRRAEAKYRAWNAHQIAVVSPFPQVRRAVAARAAELDCGARTRAPFTGGAEAVNTPVVLADRPGEAWAQLNEAIAHPSNLSGLVVGEADSRFSRWPPEYRLAALDALVEIARQGECPLVVTAAALPAAVASVIEVVSLDQAGRADLPEGTIFALAGEKGALASPWPAEVWHPTGLIAGVCANPSALADQFERTGTPAIRIDPGDYRTILDVAANTQHSPFQAAQAASHRPATDFALAVCGDIDTWVLAMGRLLAEQWTFVFAGCRPADVRMVFRSNGHVPLVDPGEFVLADSCGMRRMQFACG